MRAAQIATDTVEQDLLLVAGSIGSSGVQLAPVQALRGVAKPESGAYTLRLTTRDGRSFTHAFTADLVDHAEPPERQFAVAVPDPGVPIASVEVLHGTTPIATNAARAAAQRAGAPSIDRLRAVDWREDNAVLSEVGHQRRLAHRCHLRVKGSAHRARREPHRWCAEFGIGDLPAGGYYEVALSDG
jgi:hypothetical protein